MSPQATPDLRNKRQCLFSMNFVYEFSILKQEVAQTASAHSSASQIPQKKGYRNAAATRQASGTATRGSLQPTLGKRGPYETRAHLIGQDTPDIVSGTLRAFHWCNRINSGLFSLSLLTFLSSPDDAEGGLEATSNFFLSMQKKKKKKGFE